MARFFRNNGLTIALMLLFAGSIIGQWLAGWHFENQTLAEHGEQAITLGQFATDPQFLSTVFENWESEFLQMSAYVILTAFLYQRGSAESLDPDNPERENDELPAKRSRLSKLRKWLYEYSLGTSLAVLFVASFVLHWLSSVSAANEETTRHGGEPQTAWQYLADPELWFEFFQNWQSEFLSTAVLVVLSIFLRFKGSPESKRVVAGHDETGA